MPLVVRPSLSGNAVRGAGRLTPFEIPVVASVARSRSYCSLGGQRVLIEPDTPLLKPTNNTFVLADVSTSEQC